MYKFIVFLLCLFTATTKADLCAFGNTSALLYPQTLRNCFASIPFSDSVRNETISTLRQMITLYAFTDIVTDSGAPYNLQVDLSAGLDVIQAKTYTSDWDFHLDLATLFNQLKDAHTLYYTPTGYQKFFTIRPFDLASLEYQGSQILYTAALSLSYYGSAQNLDLSPFLGKIVTTINGVDAMTFVKNFASTIGTYKDLPVQFNAAIGYLGPFSFMTHAYLPIPAYDTETYVFSDGTNVTVKMFSYVINGNPSTASLQAENANSAKLNTNPAFNRRLFKSEGPQKFLEPYYEQLKEIKPSVSKRASSVTVLKSSVNDDTWYGIYDNNTAILKLTTFAPSAASYPYWDEFRDVVEFALSDASSRGIGNMIIDVIGNGGGYVGLSYAAARVFAKQLDDVSVYQPYDFRESELASKLVDNGYFSPYDYYVYGTEQTFSDTNFYYNGTSHTRGGRTSNYTQYFTIAVPTEATPRNSNFWMDNQGIYMDKIILLTDGTCGSACSYFANKLASEQLVYVVTVGGFVGEEMDFASFAGGNVIEWPDIVSDLQTYFPSFTGQPQNLPTSAQTRFDFTEVYFNDETVPREFTRGTSNARIYNWVYSYNVDIYPDAIALFSNVPSGRPGGQDRINFSYSSSTVVDEASFKTNMATLLGTVPSAIRVLSFSVTGAKRIMSVNVVFRVLDTDTTSGADKLQTLQNLVSSSSSDLSTNGFGSVSMDVGSTSASTTGFDATTTAGTGASTTGATTGGSVSTTTGVDVTTTTGSPVTTTASPTISTTGSAAVTTTTGSTPVTTGSAPITTTGSTPVTTGSAPVSTTIGSPTTTGSPAVSTTTGSAPVTTTTGSPTTTGSAPVTTTTGSSPVTTTTQVSSTTGTISTTGVDVTTTTDSTPVTTGTPTISTTGSAPVTTTGTIATTGVDVTTTTTDSTPVTTTSPVTTTTGSLSTTTGSTPVTTTTGSTPVTTTGSLSTTTGSPIITTTGSTPITTGSPTVSTTTGDMNTTTTTTSDTTTTTTSSTPVTTGSPTISTTGVDMTTTTTSAPVVTTTTTGSTPVTTGTPTISTTTTGDDMNTTTSVVTTTTGPVTTTTGSIPVTTGTPAISTTTTGDDMNTTSTTGLDVTTTTTGSGPVTTTGSTPVTTGSISTTGVDMTTTTTSSTPVTTTTTSSTPVTTSSPTITTTGSTPVTTGSESSTTSTTGIESSTTTTSQTTTTSSTSTSSSTTGTTSSTTSTSSSSTIGTTSSSSTTSDTTSTSSSTTSSSTSGTTSTSSTSTSGSTSSSTTGSSTQILIVDMSVAQNLTIPGLSGVSISLPGIANGTGHFSVAAPDVSGYQDPDSTPPADGTSLDISFFMSITQNGWNLEDLSQTPIYVRIQVPELSANDDLYLYDTIKEAWTLATSTCTNLVSTRDGNYILVPICHLTQFAMYRTTPSSSNTGSAAITSDLKSSTDTGVLIAAIVVPIAVVILVVILIVALYRKKTQDQKAKDEERGIELVSTYKARPASVDINELTSKTPHRASHDVSSSESESESSYSEVESSSEAEQSRPTQAKHNDKEESSESEDSSEESESTDSSEE